MKINTKITINIVHFKLQCLSLTLCKNNIGKFYIQMTELTII